MSEILCNSEVNVSPVRQLLGIPRLAIMLRILPFDELTTPRRIRQEGPELVGIWCGIEFGELNLVQGYSLNLVLNLV